MAIVVPSQAVGTHRSELRLRGLGRLTRNTLHSLSVEALPGDPQLTAEGDFSDPPLEISQVSLFPGGGVQWGLRLSTRTARHNRLLRHLVRQLPTIVLRDRPGRGNAARPSRRHRGRIGLPVRRIRDRIDRSDSSARSLRRFRMVGSLERHVRCSPPEPIAGCHHGLAGRDSDLRAVPEHRHRLPDRRPGIACVSRADAGRTPRAPLDCRLDRARHCRARHARLCRDGLPQRVDAVQQSAGGLEPPDADVCHCGTPPLGKISSLPEQGARGGHLRLCR